MGSTSGDIPSATSKAQLQSPPAITYSTSEAAILELSPENIDALSSELASSDAADPYATAENDINTPRNAPSTRPHHKWTVKPTPQPSNAARPAPTASNLPLYKKETWQVQKASLIQKFGTSTWSPRKRLSPDALSGIRALHAQYPTKYTTPVLAEQFKVSPEAIRRILKSKWQPREDEEESRRLRWEKRGEKIWERMVEVGVRAPKKWRDMGVGKPKAEDVQVRRRARGGAKKRTGGDIPWEDRREDLDADERAWEHNSLAERIL